MKFEDLDFNEKWHLMVEHIKLIENSIKHIDYKSHILTAIHSLLVSALLIYISRDTENRLTFNPVQITFLILFVASEILVFYFLLKTTFPRISKSSSPFFWHSASRMKFKDFESKYTNLSEKELLKEIYNLSKIATSKLYNIRPVYFLTFISIIIFMLLVILNFILH